MSMPTNPFPTSLEEAVAYDLADPLADVRSPDRDLVARRDLGLLDRVHADAERLGV